VAVETRPSETATIYVGHPGFEGANIHTWIGFKHFMYQLEEAALEYCRQHGLSPQELFQEYGVCLETVEARVRLLHTLHMDDRIQIEVRTDPRGVPGELALALELFVDRAGARRKALTGKVRLLLRTDDGDPAPRRASVELAALMHPSIHRSARQSAPAVSVPADVAPADAERTLPGLLRSAHGNAFVWPWRIPYFYCHYTRRLHYSGYIRLMEEVVDRFLADRGISIRTMLESRNWIPVVSGAELEILDEARLEETVYTVFTLDEILKAITFTARVDWYVYRDGALIRTATGRINHGYVGIEGRSGGQLVTFDATTMAALRGV
jgi:acyl-CoA thioesterase FadM